MNRLIASGLLFLSSLQSFAGTSLDAIPDIPDKSPLCSLGKFNYAAGAISYAKSVGLPEPTTPDAAFDTLAKKVLNTCSDGQLIELGDAAGGADIPSRVQKLLKKFCEEQDITVSPMNDVHASLQPFAKRWSCKITKLERIKAALAVTEQKTR